MRLRLFTLALIACCSLGWAAGRGEVKRNPCEAPDDAAGVITSLAHVAAALKPGSTLSVLAVGSATLFGPEASLQPGTVTSQAAAQGPQPGTVPPAQVINTEPSELAFPRQMARALEVAVPGVTVKITVRGGRGLSAADMLKLLRTG